MAHAECGRTCGCAGKTVRYLETCAIPERFWGDVSRRGAISSVRTFIMLPTVCVMLWLSGVGRWTCDKQVEPWFISTPGSRVAGQRPGLVVHSYMYTCPALLKIRLYGTIEIWLVTLRAKLSGAVYCYRSCLCVCNGRAGGRCLCVGLLPR